jgi:hypothetical protein
MGVVGQKNKKEGKKRSWLFLETQNKVIQDYDTFRIPILPPIRVIVMTRTI